MNIFCSDGSLHPWGEVFSDPQQANVLPNDPAPKSVYQPAGIFVVFLTDPRVPGVRSTDPGLS